MTTQVYDFIIIGSGFGGSISALRLTQKGYKVAVIEKGKKFSKNDYPKTNWQIKKFLWAPVLKCFGIQQISLLKGVMVLHGAGYGGGSLVYANTLMKPDDQIFQSSDWPTSVNWKNELTPYYNLAKSALGVTKNKFESAADLEIKKLGERLKVESTYHLTDVGVYFNSEQKEERDPYFGGHGPQRTPCNACGSCMIGCPVGAKNTLDKNYLFFAEKWGADVYLETHIEKIMPQRAGHENYRYKLEGKISTKYWSSTKTFHAKNVIIAAGVLGTLDILFKNKFVHKTLQNISNHLGKNVRTNGESLCGATSLSNKNADYSVGIAIGSAIHPDASTKIEPVRYPSGSDLMKYLAVPLTNGTPWSRPFKLIYQIIRSLPQLIKVYFSNKWPEKTIILLIMQSIDQKISLNLGRSFFFPFYRKLKISSDEKIPSYLPIAQTATQILAQQIDGLGQNIISEVALDTPATAHILGGAILADQQLNGVINIKHQVFGYEGLYVCDGSIIPSNLGVNPSLTISALAERFVDQFPKADHLSDSEYQLRKKII